MLIIQIFLGKFISYISKFFNLGNGSTWPGHIVLMLDKNFVSKTLRKSKIKIIFVTGTNGKTTTVKLIETILKENGKSVFINKSGANLLNGIASAVIIESNFKGTIHKDFAVFEIDENALEIVSKYIKPDYLIALNLFRDQLDRYGELDSISKSWEGIYQNLKDKTKFILNADDPKVAYLGIGKDFKADYFGLNDERLKSINKQLAADSILCPRCFSELSYKVVFYSHLGIWQCPNCNLERPKLEIANFKTYPLEGIYNRYNTLAAVQLAKNLGITIIQTEKALKKFTAAFGRQEELNINNRNIKFFLAKNPTSFNESLRTINELNGKNILLVLNDGIADGTDVSWIWDIDFENFLNAKMNILISGDRCFDLGLRISYVQNDLNFQIDNNLSQAVDKAIQNTPDNEYLYILPTYTAMLSVRKLFTGKKIL